MKKLANKEKQLNHFIKKLIVFLIALIVLVIMVMILTIVKITHASQTKLYLNIKPSYSCEVINGELNVITNIPTKVNGEIVYQ